MSRDRFDDELRAVVRRAVRRDAPDRLRDHVLEVTEQPARRPSRFPAEWRLAAGAAVAVLAVAAAYAGYSLLGPSTPASSPSPSPSTSSVVATQSPTAASAASLRWSAPGVIPDDFFPMDVVAWHGEYVAVGQLSSSTAMRGGVFTSPDGVHWTRVDSGVTFLDIPIRLAATRDHLIAIGNLQLPAGCPQGEGATCTPAEAPPVWTSTDARTWTRVDPSLFGADYLVGVQAGPRGALIEGETTAATPALWFSPDGASWQRVKLPAALEQATFSGGAVTADGFVVIGRENQPAPAGVAQQFGYGLPAAWWSTDGVTWHASTVEGAVANPGAQLGPIDVGSDGLLALGTDNPDASKSGLVWTSTDGKVFHLIGAMAGSVPYATQTASDGQHIVKLGPVSPYGAGNEDTLAAWVSTDGASWQQLTLVGDAADMPAGASGGGSSSKAQMDGVFVVGDGLIVIGSRDTTVLSWYVAATWPPASTATPSVMPSPTPGLTGYGPCAPKDLGFAAQGWGGATGTLVGGALLVNVSTNACSIGGTPSVDLLDSSGKIIARGEAAKSVSASTTLALTPGQVAMVDFVWQNWCGAGPSGALTGRLTLPGGAGTFAGPVHGPNGPDVHARCDDAAAPSTVIVPGRFTIAKGSNPGGGACAADQLLAFSGAWDLGGGSAIASLVIVNLGQRAQGFDCQLPVAPVVDLRDGSGALVTAAQEPGANSTIALPAGQAAVASLGFTSWCSAQPKLPLSMEVVLGSSHIPVISRAPIPVLSCRVPGSSERPTLAYQALFALPSAPNTSEPRPGR